MPVALFAFHVLGAALVYTGLPGHISCQAANDGDDDGMIGCGAA